MEVNKVVQKYRQIITAVDTQLYALSTTEHGVLIGVLLLLSYFLVMSPRFLLILFSALGMLLLACACYVGYRLSVRLEPKDDYE
jgi:hypothetical protein